jgi:4-amino-4-deoxy-L-arabinose transferase-like glycosyltransferase
VPWEHVSIRQHCRYTTVLEGHPNFYGFIIALGRLVSANWLPMTDSYRLGPIILFATASGIFFRQLRQHYGRAAALLGIACLLTMPRVFAHAHLAGLDGPLTACWMLTWATFDWARRSKLGCIVWGILLGLTMSCKFTGWLAISGFLAWSMLYRDRHAIRVCLVGGMVACLTFINFNPMLWNDPIDGMKQFFWLNTHRDRLGLDIPILFFGTRHDLTYPPPWYNSLAWTVLTVPPGTMLLAGCGAARAVYQWRHSPVAVSLMIHAAVLMMIKVLPFAPPHDAERLFLPSFVFVAGLAGYGSFWIIDVARTARGRWPRLVNSVLMLAVVSSGAETAWYSPQWLSYYTPLVGGVSGASRLGLEPTYYWDGFDSEVVQWIDSMSPPGARVHVSATPEFAMVTNRTTRSRLEISNNPHDCDWYVVQNRSALWTAVDRQLFLTETPRFSKTIRDPVWGFGPWCLDVPIVCVFSREQFVRAGLQFTVNVE